jgi:hypothetical protein
MKNREIYQRDPSKIKLANDGTASVNDNKTHHAMKVLRYELETFVCDGQYQKGLEHILDTYLKNIDQPQQPAVWVSGFFGSGKSHLVKMLRSLWTDTVFHDGATARGIANLPSNTKDLLVELSAQGKRHGGLHAASGTLGSGVSGSVRLALLHIIFKSVGLPEQYVAARFVMWLKKEGIYETIKEHVEQQGLDWIEEVEQFYVSEPIHEALVKVKPNTFSSLLACAETLKIQYPSEVKDISSDAMVKAIQDALSVDGKFPLTLIVLDEVQQYIGEDGQRSMDVQEAVEACCKNIGSKLLLIGTGQTAVTGTANLKKLEGRFTVRIELSDSDVDAVIRKVILAKKPDAIDSINNMMQTNLGEISKHLQETTIGHRQDDIQYFPMDYPILPIRRRFWENALRMLDQTGTDAQLRNQLSMVHKAIQRSLDESIGHVVPADYLYFHSLETMNQFHIVPRELFEMTSIWITGSEDERLMARACGLIFLINRMTSNNNEIGIRTTVDSIADLMVEDISFGSATLRRKLPTLLDKCNQLIKVDEEYRIRTKESSVWTNEFQSQRSQLASESHRIESERNDRIKQKFGQIIKNLSITHGNSKVTRNIHPTFDSSLTTECNQKICVWVRDGWSTEENSVRVDALQAGNKSPTVFVFIPQRSADDLRHYLMDYKAAKTTLEIKGTPNTPEGIEAHAAMETIKRSAEGKIRDFLEDVFMGSRVFQGGGNEILGNDLQSMIREAAENSLERLYPQFHLADHAGWDKVYANAKKGSPDALKAVGWDGEPANNPVCKSILSFIAGGKSGADIRVKFENEEYGWSGDAVDGGLQTLLVAGIIRAQDERGQLIDPKELERKAIGKAIFKIESAQVGAGQRIKIRSLFLKVGCQVKEGEELSAVPQFLQTMYILADNAGGDAPKPERPDVSILNEIRQTVGNEQLLLIVSNSEELTKSIDGWTKLGTRIKERWSSWETLVSLESNADGIADADIIKAQLQYIKDNRLLLEEPDQVSPLIANLTQLLRDTLNNFDSEFKVNYEYGMSRLNNDSNWLQLELEQRNKLLADQKLDKTNYPKINLSSTEEILKTLNRISISMFSERVTAMPSRFEKVLEKAAKLMEPQVHFVPISRRMLKNENEIDEWVNEVKQQLKSELSKGPIMIQ